ncbi:MAG: hypothetical protein WC284_15550 [Candidimonas sp.]
MSTFCSVSEKFVTIFVGINGNGSIGSSVQFIDDPLMRVNYAAFRPFNENEPIDFKNGFAVTLHGLCLRLINYGVNDEMAKELTSLIVAYRENPTIKVYEEIVDNIITVSLPFMSGKRVHNWTRLIYRRAFDHGAADKVSQLEQLMVRRAADPEDVRQMI